METDTVDDVFPVSSRMFCHTCQLIRSSRANAYSLDLNEVLVPRCSETTWYSLFFRSPDFEMQTKNLEHKGKAPPASTEVIWSWQRQGDDEWLALSVDHAREVEAEYQRHVHNTRAGQRIYHCFGDGCSACIDFKNMRTYCGSGRCRCLPDPAHMTFKLLRTRCDAAKTKMDLE